MAVIESGRLEDVYNPPGLIEFALRSLPAMQLADGSFCLEVVEGRPGYFQRRMQEFEERRRAGRGVFITHEQIETSGAATMADVLRGIPGVRLNCRSGVCAIRSSLTR